MTELERLIAKAEQIAATGDRISAVFAAELARVWVQIERQLAQVVVSTGETASVAALRDRIRAVLTSAGYDALATAAAQAAIEQMAAVVLGQADIARVALDTRLAALQQMAAIDLLGQGDDAALAIWRAVAQQVIAERPAAQVLADLSAVLDRKQSVIATLFDTQVSIFGRQVEALNDLGPEQPYLYAGPIDYKTRDFCLDLVGQVVTRERIDEMDNGQLPNVFLTGGGYNCRHSWIAVESKAMRALANTGERAEGFGADVERLRTLKAAKRRKAA